ncbi:epsin-3-like [Oryza brachyantha]|uniref:ENTH domain-containing protein n=1 Tax=Oryza brachyantha TaxID=4533 RepID=J3MVG6_ORYBR|nr:epsin-3-like [Oryza brachyantha]
MATRWHLLGQASGFLQDKYKQARLALGDVTPAELLVQEATNNDASVGPDARTLACIADAAFDMDDYWRIAAVLRRRMARAADWKEWRPVYKALVVLEFLLTHGPDEVPRDFLPDIAALRDLRGFTHIDDRGFDWGACMQRRCDSVLALLTDADRLRDARRRAIRVSHEVHHGCLAGACFSPSSSGSPSSASSRTSSHTSSWSVASDSPTMVCLCAGADYRHDKKFDAYTADDDWMQQLVHSKTTSREEVAEYDDDDDDECPNDPHTHSWDANIGDLSLLPRRTGTGGGAWSARFCTRMLGSSRASGFRSLSQPERRAATASKKLQRQLSLD